MIKYKHKGDVKKVYLEDFLEQYKDKKVKMFEKVLTNFKNDI